ncbi:MAG: tetratricopeptide repeat protein [Calothrix sp. MO_192.B10]|nr:tetratricopeptide repeat protein [Calothrix sp. MO_192.B10]
MSEARNRWIIKIVLVLAIFAFIGVSMLPIIEALSNGQGSSLNSATAQSKSSVSNQKSKLVNEIQGLELVLQREPNNQATLRSLLERQLQLLQLGEGNLQGIIETLEKLAKLNPEQTKYSVLLAQAKQQANDKEGAAQTYRSILETKPGNLEALQGMVMLLLEQKRPEAAIGLLEDTLSKATQANKIEPGSVDIVAVQVLLGNVRASQKRYGQALAAYDMAIKNNKQDFRPVLAKAMLLKEQGKIDEAKPLFTTAATLAPAQYKDEINKQAATPATPKSPKEKE